MIRSLVAVFCLLACAADADTVKVGAGEHGSFTRVILEFSDRPKWDGRRTGRGYRLTFDNTTPLDFDLSRVFRLIDRNRVSDVRASGNNRLDLDLSCDCDLRFDEAGDTALIVDILPLSSEEPEIQSELDSLASPAGGFAMPILPGRSVHSADRFSPSSIPAVTLESAPAVPLLPDAVGGLQSLDFPVSDQSLALEMMGRALSRAAAQGLISANTDIDPQSSNPAGRRLDLPDNQGNVSVTTSFDRAMRPDAATTSPAQDGAICTPTAQIDVAAWGDIGDRNMLGRLRKKAIAENGSVNTKGAGTLARYYIYLGFGREARAAVEYLPQSMDRQIVEALADIMDYGQSDARFLAGQVACESAAALWATLAAPMEAETTPASSDAILSTFSALPPHLRNHLGPLLSERLHDAGLREEARVAINAVTRSGKKTEESELASARLELEGTHGNVARETLSDLSNGTNLTAAGALLELLQDAENRGMPPNPDWVEDAPSLIGALEGTEIAEDLNIAALRGLVALGRFGEFRKAVVEDAPGLTPEVRLELARHGLAAALVEGSDQDFLLTELVLSRIVGPASLDADTRVSMATRLMDIGLADRALVYAQQVPETPDEYAVAVRVLIATGQSEMAVELASHGDFDGAKHLLATAFAAAGEDVEAIEAFASAGVMESAVETALRTGNWARVSELGPEPIAEASRILSEPSQANATVENPNGTLVQLTRKRRAQIDALLGRTRPQEGTAPFTN